YHQRPSQEVDDTRISGETQVCEDMCLLEESLAQTISTALYGNVSAKAMITALLFVSSILRLKYPKEAGLIEVENTFRQASSSHSKSTFKIGLEQLKVISKRCP